MSDEIKKKDVSKVLQTFGKKKRQLQKTGQIQIDGKVFVMTR